MALSFQEAEGCAMIWFVARSLAALRATILTASNRRFVNNVQQTFHNNLAGAGMSFSRSPSSASSLTMRPDDSLSDDLTVDIHPPSVNLPAAELGHLQEIDTGMRIMSNTAAGRDALAKFIMADDYIGKLIPLVEMAEDLESLPELHRLCNIMKSIILLNDTTIIEHAVSDENVLGVVGALEYDPDFPSHKANHRHWLDNQGRYKEVVPIEDENTRRKIHQTYRLQYLKDVVLARILDDPTFSVLNSLIFFNQVDIVQHLQSNAAFLNDLFGIFTATQPDHKRKKEAVLFIQQCCAIAKTIQPPARQSLYNNFIAHGLLQVIHFGLRHDDVAVRVGATDILVSIIDHDAQMIRQTIYRQMHENQPSLTDSLIELLLVEVDLGVKSQISEAVKVLLDQGIQGQGPEVMTKVNGEFMGRPRPQQSADPQQELFLTRFYDRSATKLFKPLIDLESSSDMNFPVQQASMFSYLIEILSFFIRQHHRFSRYFVMNNNIVERVVHLINSPEKYLRLVAIRFFRCLIGLQEEFYIKQIIEKRVLGPILDVLIATMPRDNLLSSACLELFEFIKKENMKELVKHLVENYRDRLAELSYMSTFREIVLRYDQTQGFTTDVEYFLESEEDMTRRQPPNARLMEHITVDPQEEEYWANSDPEDDGDDDHNNETNGTAPSKPLVDYASDEEGDDGTGGEETMKDENEENGEPSTKEPESEVAPPERISEKRRREEDEDEDELGKLVANKRRNSSSSDANSVASGRLSARRRSFSAGAGNANPKKIAISLSPALKSGGDMRSDDET